MIYLIDNTIDGQGASPREILSALNRLRPGMETVVERFMDASLCNPDPFHANAAYGALIVDQVAGHMAQAR